MKRWLLCSLLVVSCGGSRAPAEAPSGYPGGESPPPPADQDSDGKAERTTTENRFAEPPGSTKEVDEGEGMTLTAAQTLFDRSASELSESVLDCGKACKALGSMERSMGRICELVGPDDPEKRCESAREKARTARERVEKHCPRCS